MENFLFMNVYKVPEVPIRERVHVTTVSVIFFPGTIMATPKEVRKSVERDPPLFPFFLTDYSNRQPHVSYRFITNLPEESLPSRFFFYVAPEGQC